MSSFRPGSRALWLLPIVLAVSAVMVLPGGAFQAAAAHPGSPLAAAQGIVTSASASTANPFRLPSDGAIGSASPVPSSAATTALDDLPFSQSPSYSFGPSAGPLTTIQLPGYLDHVPWAQAIVSAHSTIQPTTSWPNIGVLEHPISSVDGQISPPVVAQPAPLGLTDYGLGAQTYAYNTSHLAGVVTFNAPPNASQPGGQGVVLPTLGAQHDGAVGSLYEFGIQLNTVATNLTIPGTDDQGYAWTQNVVNWNDTAIHFVQDTFNFSLDSDAYMAQNSIYSGCNNDTAGVNLILDVYGGVLQCVGGSIPIDAADYPLTLTLYNNVTTNAQERSEVSYGYSLFEAGTGTYRSGVLSTVVFNNTAPTWQAPAPPVNLPGYGVNGFAPTPTFGPNEGFAQDAELDLVGGINGDNAVFRSLNGTVALQYSNESVGGWQNVPSAYNFGTDTGETSTGIADYWTPGHSLEVNQGPAMLYGLWDAEPQVSVPSGDIQVSGSITPSYGFVFASNTPAVDAPFAPGAPRDNMSWLPTNDAGSFNTYLPPLGGKWTSTYYLQAFASGAREYNGSITSGTTSLAIHLAPAHGLLQAPLYMYDAAQAAALSAATGGSTSAPYRFSDLTVGVNASFDHLNDADYPSFEVFSSQGTGYAVDVHNVYQGTDNGTSAADNSYFWDAVSSGSTGILVPGPTILSGLENYTSGINIWNGVDDRVTGQTLYNVGSQGSQVVLWNDLDAIVVDTTAFDTEYGVWVGDSTGTLVGNTTVEFDLGVSDFGSTGTNVWNEFVDDGLGVETTGSFDGTYSWLNVTGFGVGVESGADFAGIPAYYDYPGSSGLVVNDVNVTYAGEAANVTFSVETTLNQISLYTPETSEGLGVALDGDVDTTVNGLAANYAAGIDLWNATGTTVNDWSQSNYDAFYGGLVQESTGTELAGLTVTDEEAGPIFYVDTDTTIANALVEDVDLGVELEYQDGITGDLLQSVDAEFAYEIDFGTGTISVTDVVAEATSIGLNVDFTSGAVVSDVAVDATVYTNPDSAGVDFLDSVHGSVSDVTATDDSLGVRLFFLDTGANTNSVSNVLAETGSTGVEVDGSIGNTISAVDAADDTTGVLLDAGAADNTVTTIVAATDSTGVVFTNADDNSASHLTATGDSVGALVLSGAADNSVSGVTALDDSTGVALSGANGNSVSGVTASGGSVGVVVDPSSGVTVSDVSASDASIAVVFEGSTHSSATDISAVNGSIGVAIGPETGVPTYYSSDIDVSGVTVSNLSIAVLAEESGELDISAVTATNVTLSSPWTTGDFAFSGVPIAAIVTLDDYQVQVAGVTTTNYPIGLYDDDSGTGTFGPGGIYLQGLTSTDGVYALELNFTEESLFSGVTATGDQVGALFFEADGNDLTGSSFTDSASYGVALWYCDSDSVWDNSFVGNNGATATYSAAHIQAFSSYANSFDSPVSPYTGNYWADWHSWNLNGELNPYYVGYNNWDYEPLAVPADESAVWFFESGLAGGTTWSVTFDGTTQTSADLWMVFGVAAGTYSYTVGSIAGYLAAPPSGTVTTGATGVTEVDLAFSATTDVVVTESGLATGTSWTATFNGVTESATTSSISFAVPAGTWFYQISPVAGYTASPASGTVTVSGTTFDLVVAFTPTSSPTTVSFTESGLPTDTNWSATFNGVTESSTTSTIAFSASTGTYGYQVSPVAGYTVAPSIGTVTVASSSYAIVVTFTQVTYAVTMSASGLAAGTTWSGTVNGLTETTSGTTLTWYLPNGTYTYSIATPSGYRLASSGASVVVNGAPGTIDAAFASTAASGFVGTGTFTTWVVVALVLALIALGIAVLAFATRRREETPPAEWKGPVTEGTTPAGGSPPTTGAPAAAPAPAESPAAAPAPPPTHDEWDEEPEKPA